MTDMSPWPKKYNSLEIEKKWLEVWENQRVYAYDPSQPRSETFVIDTPPPTVSGSLHVGHVFSYTQTDIVARYQRMKGKNIFYPIGWDDNGLPTERRVQSIYKIRCNPTLSETNPGALDPGDENDKKAPIREVSREDFLTACRAQTTADEKKYEELWRHLGLSFDWEQQYSTIDPHCQKISQLSFLDMVEKGFAYSNYAPTMWDTTFQTAVAQAEVEEREKAGHYHDISFQTTDGESFVISTTRPELLAACIAVVAHPNDKRYQHLFGKKAVTPLFQAEVPILAAEHADPEKGTGILMICTFGDTADVDFWKASKLPLKQIIGKDGKMKAVSFREAPFDSLNPDEAQKAYDSLQGLYVKQARKKMRELLENSGALTQEPKSTQQFAKFYEKGEEPLEFIATRQWFVNILDHKKALLEMGKKVNWHPEHMIKRYETWVEGLNQDWCISRQRFFGVPIPVWYPLAPTGEVQYDKPIYAKAEQLPCDPQVQVPEGFSENQRNCPGGFIGDPDVMDTWATSSVTPQINSRWQIENDRHEKLFPADFRPQAHEIIRTWAFYTIVKSWIHESEVPWHHIAISGWVVNPDRKKMSKSKGNTVTPEDLMVTYSADALRYWAGKARLGQDTIYDENVFKIGQRLGTKIFNAAKFVLMQLQDESGKIYHYNTDKITHPIDQAWFQKMNELILKSTQLFERFEYSHALALVEAEFWDFCDFYIELVKGRAYALKEEAAGISANATLDWSLKQFIKLLAPFMPYVTEEVWSWAYQEESPSIHKSLWPKSQGEITPDGRERLDSVRNVLNQVRGTKSKANKALKWPVEIMSIQTNVEIKTLIESAEDDLLRAANCSSKINFQASKESDIKIDVTLAPEEA